MKTRRCEVCKTEHTEDNLHVRCSGLGAVSFAYCKDCLKSGSEPYEMLLSAVNVAGGIDKCAAWVVGIVEPTLKATGKTREQFNEDLVRTKEVYGDFLDAMSKEFPVDLSMNAEKDERDTVEVIEIDPDNLPAFDANLGEDPVCYKRFVSIEDGSQFFATAKEDDTYRLMLISGDNSVSCRKLFVTEDALQEKFKALPDMDFMPTTLSEIKKIIM